ncbi:glycosyltransferase family 4 protein [Gemmatimonadota bacterium]
MRVCRITSEFPPPWIGLSPGPFQLSLAQERRGNEVTVIAKDRPGSGLVDREVGFRIIRVSARFDLEFSIKARRIAVQLHRERKQDIIHGHGFSAEGLLFARPVELRAVPIITHFHIVRKAQHIVLPERSVGRTGKLSRRWVTLQEGLVARRSDALITVSQGLKEELAQHYEIPGGKVQVAWNGVDVDLFSPAPGQRRERNELRLLWVGKFDGRKGERDLLDMMQGLRREEAQVALTMVGDGPGRSDFEAAVADSGLGERVRVLPHVDFHRIPLVYREADVFVFPSRSEGMPKVVLEAMASGLPIVASDIPGCRELVENGQNGFLIPPRRTDLLIQALRDLHSGEAMIPAMGLESRRIAEKGLSWDATAERIEESYREVISR